MTSALDMPKIMSYIYNKSWKLQFSASSSIIIIEDFYLQTFLHSLVKISNLQQMAETLIFLQENQFDSLEQLQHESDTISKQIDNLSDQKNNLQDQIADLNTKIHYLGQYHVNKKYFSSMLKSDNKADYRKTHSDKIAQYDEARNFLKSVYPDSDYPDLNQLKNQRKQILTDYKSLNSDIHDLYKQNQKLKIVSHNSQELLSHKQVISRENLHL